MRSSLALFTIIVLTILTQSIVTAYAEQSSSVNITNAKNIAEVLNSTKVANTTMSENVTARENSTATLNATIPSNITLKNNSLINVTADVSDIDKPAKAIFVIDNGVTPIRHAENADSSMNGAWLVRAVDGTPHGYVTYYN